MKVLNCPLNGPRNFSEFIYGGELHEMPDANNATAKEWAEYIFYSDNLADVVLEWWCHAATSFWFIAQRHTVSNEIVRTFVPSELFIEHAEPGDQLT